MAGICSGLNFPNCSVEYLAPDPDIAGVGVMVSFIFVNGLTVVVTIIAILFMELKRLQMSNMDVIHNSLERLGLKPLSKKMNQRRIELWLRILEKVLLGLSDTQLLTGMAILIAGYVKCNISVYHSTIVMDLAWFASGAHTSSLQVLRDYMIKHPATRALRIVLLLSMAALLLSLVVYQGNKYWYDYTATPAQCLFADTRKYGNFGGKPALWMALFVSFTVLEYAVSISSLFENNALWPIAKMYKSLMLKLGWLIITSIKNLFTLPRNVWKESRKFLAIVLPFVVSAELLFAFAFLLPLTIIWVMMYIGYLMIDSYFIGIIFDIIWFALGLFSLIEDRKSYRGYMSDEDKDVEDQWGFGQFVPCFLIFLPIMTAWEIWYEERCGVKMDKERAATPSPPEEISQPTIPLYQVHCNTSDPHLTKINRDSRGREITENGSLNETCENRLRPPPRAHSRSSSLDSELDSNLAIVSTPINSRSRDRLIPVVNKSITGHDSLPNASENSTPVDLNTTGSTPRMPGGKSLSRRRTTFGW